MEAILAIAHVDGSENIVTVSQQGIKNNGPTNRQSKLYSDALATKMRPKGGTEIFYSKQKTQWLGDR